jgi:hypothetical protein
MSVTKHMALVGAWLALIGVAGCASNRPSGTRVKQVEHEALMTVTAIDVPNRLVTVRGASGDTLTVYVDKSKKDFPQAAVGDQVRIRYVESIAISLAKPSAVTGELTVKEETSQPKPGKQSGKTATEVTAIAKIEEVNQDGSVVTFTGPRGRRTIKIKDPSMRDFVRQLRSGDKVEVTYNEAFALSLEKANR